MLKMAEQQDGNLDSQCYHETILFIDSVNISWVTNLYKALF